MVLVAMLCPTVAPRGTIGNNSLPVRSFVSSRAAFLPAQRAQQGHRGYLQIRAALSRSAKEEQLARLVGLFSESAVVFGMRYQGLSVKQIDVLRRSLPKESTMLVCKNTLVKRAADSVEGWSELKAAAKGDNVWLFIPEDHVAEAIKAYLAFETQLYDELPVDEREGVSLASVTGSVMGGRLLTMAELRNLESMPTRRELMATIARLLKQMPIRLARSLNQVPTKLAYSLALLAAGDDDKSKLVGDVFPKPKSA